MLDGETVLPFDLPPALEPAARALGIIARELIAFAHAARGAPAPFERHATLLRRTIAETIFPDPVTRRRRLAMRCARWWTWRRSCPPTWR